MTLFDIFNFFFNATILKSLANREFNYFLFFFFNQQFSQVKSDDELTRERCLKFLGTRLKQLEKEIITEEIENFIVEQLKSTLLVSVFEHSFFRTGNI